MFLFVHPIEDDYKDKEPLQGWTNTDVHPKVLWKFHSCRMNNRVNSPDLGCLEYLLEI